jgi:hypothetical protein
VPYLGPPKTEASVRTIPLPLIVVDSIAAHLAEYEPGDLRTIFSGDRGEPLRRNRFSERVWRPAVARAGLRPGTRFHDLRHYYASLLIRYGESVETVQARLGHASATETLDTYAHLWPDSEDRTRDAVDSMLGPAVWPRSGPIARIKSLVKGLMTVSRPVGGVLFVLWGRGGHPSQRPTWGLPTWGGRATHVPRSALLRVGFTEPAGSPRPLVRSCRTVSPLPVRARARHRRSALCCTFLRVAPTGR